MIFMEKNTDEFELIKRRLRVLISSKLRSEDKIQEAVEIQDRLSQKSNSWSGEKEIIRWREMH